MASEVEELRERIEALERLLLEINARLAAIERLKMSDIVRAGMGLR